MSIPKSLLLSFNELSLTQLTSVQLSHLVSNVTRNEAEQNHNDTVSTIEGYTEWISTTSPVISIGWDWTTTIKNKSLTLRISGYPYSNMTLVDKFGIALPEQIRLIRLKSFIEGIDWQETVALNIAHVKTD